MNRIPRAIAATTVALTMLLIGGSARAQTATPTPAPTPTLTITPNRAVVKCQRVISKESAKFLAKRTKLLTKCEIQKVDEVHLDECPDPNAPVGSRGERAAFKIAKARARLIQRIEQKCGGKDKICGNDLDTEVGGAALNWGTECPNIAQGPCTNAIGTDSCAGIGECVACLAETASDQVLDLTFDAYIAWPAANKSQNTCQGGFGKAMNGWVGKKAVTVQKCWNSRIKGKHHELCPDINGTAKGTARKTALKINKAESKAVKKMCLTCGGGPNDGLGVPVSRKCDIDVPLLSPPLSSVEGEPGFGDDFTRAEIGWVSNCPPVIIPGGPSCYRPIDTLVDMVQCVDCVAEFGVDCVTRAAVQNFAPYPVECNAFAPTPTVTPTPVATVTPSATPTPMPTATSATPIFTPTPVPTAIPCGDAGILQCDGTCPTGLICVSIDLFCHCDNASKYPSCADSTVGAPICWGNCPPASPICRDIGGVCTCSPF